MIRREDVADLREGDVVELSRAVNLAAKVTGGVVEIDRRLYVGPFMIRWQDGSVPVDVNHLSLTVVSRAPRPLYVNSDRAEPVEGDIVRDRDGDAWRRAVGRWFMAAGSSPGVPDIDDCKPLTLLWDGTSGQVVPS